MRISYLLLVSACVCSLYSHGQLTGGRENGQKAPSVSEPGTLSGGIYSGDVNIFTGEYQSSIPLGSLSTPSGLSYNLELSRGSSFSFGSNEPMVKGLLYGEGWSLNIPVVTVSTDIFHRFGNGDECNDQTTDPLHNTNTKPSDYPASWEGDVFWMEPYVSIPGVGSGRAVFKYVDVNDAHCAVFVLNKFSAPVELRFYGSSWTVSTGDGTVYVFEGAVQQFAAPSNKRQHHYENQTSPSDPGLSGTKILTDNSYATDGGIPNVTEPKLYYNSWYCSRIFHPNHYGHNIVFEYERYGAFNFYPEFRQPNYAFVHKDLFQDRTSKYLPDYTTYREIVLRRVISSALEEHLEVLELEYGIDETLASPYLMVPGVNGAVASDPMYCSQVVERFDGTTAHPYSGWHRYPHANRSGTMDPGNLDPFNPYLNTSGQYTRESVTPNAGGIPFDHGFLESKRIQQAEALVPGDLYEIRTRVTRSGGTDLKNGNGTLDIAVVTNHNPNVAYTEPSSVIPGDVYRNTRGEQLFATFNMALKWQMGYNETTLETSNLFMMPDLPSSFGGFNIQVGPGNSDIVYNYYSPDLYYTLADPVSTALNKPNALWAYPQLRGQSSLKSAGTIPRNFGTGHPWGIVFPVYNHRALTGANPLTGSPASHQELYTGTWSMSPQDVLLHGSDFHNPTKFDNSVKLESVELIRHGRTAYMLRGVKHYRMEGEYGGAVTEGQQLVAQKRLTYQVSTAPVRRNLPYQDSDPVGATGNSQSVILLQSVHEVPVEGDLYATDFGLTDPAVVLTTAFGYTNLLPASGTYSDLTPYTGLAHYALTSITDNLGGETQIEYYPLSHGATRTYATTNFNWNCGMYTPASYGAEKSYNTNLAVRYITRTAADYDEVAQEFVSSTRRREYVYDLTKNTFNFKRLSTQSVHFRGMHPYHSDRGFAKVTVYEPALATGERNYAVHEFFGKVNTELSYTSPATITDFLYYGKPKSIQSYDHQGILHASREYQYAHTLAFEDGYGRPNFYRDHLNTYVEHISDGYEYRDYYKGDAPTLDIGSGVLTGDAAKQGLAGRSRSLSGEAGVSLEQPKYLPFYFFHQLRVPSELRDVNGELISMLYNNPEYLFHSYFVKLVSETERVYEDGLAKQSKPVVPEGAVGDFQPVSPNPFGTGIVIPWATEQDSAQLSFLATNTGAASYDYLMGFASLSEQVLTAAAMSDSFSFDQRTDILVHQQGLSNNVWGGIIANYEYFTPAQLQRLVMSQPYFTDTIQQAALQRRINDNEFLTALLTRNPYLSDTVVYAITTTPADWIGVSYEQALSVQPHLLREDLLQGILTATDKTKSGNLVQLVRHQRLTNETYRHIIDNPAFLTKSVYNLLMEADFQASDSVLFHFFDTRTVNTVQAQQLVDHFERNFPPFLRNKISGLHAGVIFTPQPPSNPLDVHCTNPVSGTRIFIETKTEYLYYEADYRGLTTNKAYELLLGMIPDIDAPSSFPKTVSAGEGNITVPSLRLKYEPSWQLFSKKTTSPHLPGAYQREEYFYLYDLQNRYARYWMHYDIQDNLAYSIGEYGSPTVTDTFAYNTNLHADYTTPFPPLIPEFDGMVKSREYNLRSVPFQKTVISKNAADAQPVARSEYYHYDSRWRFDDLYVSPTNIAFEGDSCPPAPVEPECDCIYENHIFGEYEFNLMQGRYPLSAYCYHHLGGDGTGWQYAYWVCPKNVDAPSCYDGITSTICSEEEIPEFGEGPQGPVLLPPVGEMLSKTLQLRHVSVQVDTFVYSGRNDFYNEKWDRNNRYIAEFAMDGTGMDTNQFQGKNYRMILPYTSLLTQRINARNRYLQVKVQEDATGLKTRFYYTMPEFRNYTNTHCPSEQYNTIVYRSTALPVRITTGYEREDSLSTAYTYTPSGQVASTRDANGLEMHYAFDGFNRLRTVREFSGGDTLLLSETRYHLWDRTPAHSFMERAAQNYVEQRTFNSTDTTDYAFTRTYADPLGRAAGSVTAYNHEGNTRHIYQGSVFYDKWDRAQKQFKNTFNQLSVPTGQTHAVPGLLWDFSTPYTEAQLENTPKSRARKATGFGVDIHDAASRTVRTFYAIANNIYTSCELGLSLDELNQVMRPASTSTFRFLRTETLDQDDHRTVTYTNAFGQMVGTIAYLGTTQRAVTLFVYDSQGNLSKVINPNKQQSTYEYNLLGQLFRETTPDAGEKRYMYNKRGQVSYALDQQLWKRIEDNKAAPLYRSFSYDAYGRPIETGLTTGPVYTNSHVYGFMHYKTDFYGTVIGSDSLPICTPYPYPDTCAYFKYVFSHGATQDWLVHFEVTQRELHPAHPENIQVPVTIQLPEWENGWPYFGPPVIQPEKRFVYGNLPYQFNRGKLRHTESYNNTGQEVLRTYYAYNQRGQLSMQETYFNETPNVIANITTITPFFIYYNDYSTQGLLLSQTINIGGGGVLYAYAYDGLGRPRTISASDTPNNFREIVSYDYDDAEGVLSSKTHTLDKELVTTKYAYDVQQRLSSIQALNKTTYAPERTLMRHQYYYDHQVPYHNFGSGLPPQFGFNHNGNINGVLTTYDFAGTYGPSPALFSEPLLYGYRYDHLNRLILADGTVGDFVASATNEQINDSYLIGDEDYTYDKIGNLTRLQRKLRSTDPMEMVKNEGWYYNYGLGNNRLMSVSGMPGSVTRGYSYDWNGNLLTDTYKQITDTEYGRSAYAFAITTTDHKFLYLYSTDDQRMYKSVETETGTTTEFYLQDASGKTVGVRRKVDSGPASWEYYVNGTEREARLKDLNHTGGIEPKEIEFYLYDHLGNTRVVYQPKAVGANLELVINYAADYFPYGKILKEYVNTGSGDPEKFLTTQHERDQETGLDYRGARFYDSDIARFLSLDPLATEFPGWSAYNYVMGNPISLVDPTGKSPEGNGDKDKKKPGKGKGDDSGGSLFQNVENAIYRNIDGSEKVTELSGFTLTEDMPLHIQLSNNNFLMNMRQNAMDELNSWAMNNPEIVARNHREYQIHLKLKLSDPMRDHNTLQSGRAEPLDWFWTLFLPGPKGIGATGSASRAATNVTVQFGKTSNQISHAFRHTDALGLDRALVQSSIQTHFKTASSQIVAGKPFNQIIEIGGQKLQYTAFKLSDGTFNIGRIHGIK